ncbi:MAG: hypothetical protein JJ971_02780 [Balneolaceae bacterium]|nr:hypothetical protein [Balneolaceae bacterium]MBO6545295.1 hypothetical protein [Balneolaceae bacterium]MBO6646691.1 hypothetical protein [Balneolaceae bacterium]
MKKYFNEIKYLSFAIGLVIIVKITQYFFLLPFIERAFYGESIQYLNELISRHASKAPYTRTIEFYLTEAPKFVNRLLFLSLLFLFLSYFLLKDKSNRVRSFFLSTEPGLSLAIVRITVVSVILFSNFPDKLNSVLTLGPDNIYPPPGWSKSLIELLIEQPFIDLFQISFVVFLIGALIGFYTNHMLLGALITGFVVMGVPQFFGKIDHYHILWYSLFILSVSDSGNSLSIDNWLKKRAQLNFQKAARFGLPLKIVMILIGITYLFPGIWKFTFSGLEWAFSDNLKYKLYSKWVEFPEWTPIFRLDKYPFIYQSAAFITLIVEIGFVFALFFKKIRPLFIISALGFHFFVFLFLKISFLGHVLMYVVFINWDSVFKKTSLFVKKIGHLKHEILPVDKIKIRIQIMVGSILIVGSSLSGTLLIDSWPFGVYPTFASIENDTIPSISIVIENGSSNSKTTVIPLIESEFHSLFDNVGRLRKETERLYRANSVNQKDVKEFIDTLENSFITSNDPHTITFYKIRISTDPDVLERIESVEEQIIQVMIAQ